MRVDYDKRSRVLGIEFIGRKKFNVNEFQTFASARRRVDCAFPRFSKFGTVSPLSRFAQKAQC